GGILELGETVREGVAREALEETGLTVEPLELLGVFDRVVRDLDERTLYHYVLIDFLCQRVSGELCAAGDVDEARWFSAEELARPDAGLNQSYSPVELRSPRATALSLSHLTWSLDTSTAIRTCHPTTSFPVYSQNSTHPGLGSSGWLSESSPN